MLVRSSALDDTVAILSPPLQTPYEGGLFSRSLTPTLLRLDPDLDPLRNGPGFQLVLTGQQQVGP
jgi:hypothetical protein